MSAPDESPVLITGGCGFIGTNLATALLLHGERVLLLDNLSRSGSERNLEVLKRRFPERLEVRIGDVRDPDTVAAAVRRARIVFHFAAQVAVTTSLVTPRHDFEVNALGTLNVLEAIRRQKSPPPIVYTSTNKVYGGLSDLALREGDARWGPADEGLAARGVGEWRGLDFHSPYGCSKGSADQYVLDYARSFGLRAVVFRMSCIYGLHQMGNEDQGWVAHFLVRALDGAPITLYGDGKQVRDVLFVEDLVEAFLAVARDVDAVSGEVFNVGGGPERAISLLELVDLIGEISGERPGVRFDTWRVGDQRWYVSDTKKLQARTGWTPRVSVRDGVTRLYDWLLHEPAPSPGLPIAAPRPSPDAGRIAGAKQP